MGTCTRLARLLIASRRRAISGELACTRVHRCFGNLPSYESHCISQLQSHKLDQMHLSPIRQPVRKVTRDFYTRYFIVFAIRDYIFAALFVYLIAALTVTGIQAHRLMQVFRFPRWINAYSASDLPNLRWKIQLRIHTHYWQVKDWLLFAPVSCERTIRRLFENPSSWKREQTYAHIRTERHGTRTHMISTRSSLGKW